jgi:exodeoxyribonuclease VII large subunit
VSDLRAPTPTAAAELATPNQADLRLEIFEFLTRLTQALQGYSGELRWTFKEMQASLERNSPLLLVRTGSQRVDELERRLSINTRHLLELRRIQLAGLTQRIEALNPRAVLERGYAIVTNQAEQAISRVAQVLAGEALNVRVSDGDFGVHVDGS